MVFCLVCAWMLSGHAQSVNTTGHGNDSRSSVRADDAQRLVTQWTVAPTSLVSRDTPPLQQIKLSFNTTKRLEAGRLEVRSVEGLIVAKSLGTGKDGLNHVSVLLPEPQSTIPSQWVLLDGKTVLAETNLVWHTPRHWTLYVIKSSHTDIGLHDAQYRQRANGVGYIDRARKLADQTADWPDASRYRYHVEVLWWWMNYAQDRSAAMVDQIVEDYVKLGVFGIGASHSGNHTQVYGEEQLCRSAYYAQQVRDRWGLPMDTMIMADNNGLSWPLANAYADAGIRYLCFFPNYWNPDTVGESRHSAWFDSPQPHVFYWQGPDRQSRVMVWASPHYTKSAPFFGFQSCQNRHPNNIDIKRIAPKLAEQLALLESKYPYDVWLIPNYSDDEPPDTKLAEMTKAWNAQWRWPEFRTIADLSVPFKEIENRFGDQIPTLSGTITGGWAQHPLSTPTFLARKFEADRRLPVAEKLSALATLIDPAYAYPATELWRAWDALVCNDEHGYGTSVAYKGRPVYETWLQKNDWIERARKTADTEMERAMQTLCAHVPADVASVVVFNPTLAARAETVEIELPEACSKLRTVLWPDGSVAPAVTEGNTIRFRTSSLPSFGYTLFRLAAGKASGITRKSVATPPSLENAFYRITFGEDGTLTSLFDKALERELLERSAPYRCNQFIYTKDANKTFRSPTSASFTIETSALEQTVVATIDDPFSGAKITQRVSLPAHEKRIDIDNRLDHVVGLSETNRWFHFGYYAFPFAVPDGTFRVGLNGCAADPYRDQTGHGTDTYHAPREWSYVGNAQFGVTLLQLDSQLIEYGRIHEKKNTLEGQPENTRLYSCLFNNWLYGHAWASGPSHMNLRYRYVITSGGGAFAAASVPRLAERATTPLVASVIPQAQTGTLPAVSNSFLSVDAQNVRLLALKKSETPGQGLIARFLETDGVATDAVRVNIGWDANARLTRCSLTEQNRIVLKTPAIDLKPYGYETLRIEHTGASTARAEPKGATAVSESSAPAKVGSVYTGLVDAPRAWFGDNGDMLYLQWGQNREPSLSHYELYRGDTPDFLIGAQTFVAKVDPGRWRTTVRYEDKGLQANTVYYYRVLAVDADNNKSEPSDLCKGMTREILN